LKVWTDERLRWEPSRFRNQTYIVSPATDVWLPDIAVRNRYAIDRQTEWHLCRQLCENCENTG